MGIFYVNDHLIDEELMGDGKWPGGNEAYKRYFLRTTSQAVKKTDDGKMEPTVRPICVHNVSLNPQAKTRISSIINEQSRFPKITVRTSSDTRYDSDVFVVALPYNGMIKPFEHNEEALAIYKSIIVKSDAFTIKHEDTSYKRCAYFVVRPHHAHIGSNGWYNEECDLVVTFVQSNRVKGKPESETTWTFKTVRVSFGTNGQYEISSSEETAPYDSFDPDAARKMAICTTVEPTKIED